MYYYIWSTEMLFEDAETMEEIADAFANWHGFFREMEEAGVEVVTSNDHMVVLKTSDPDIAEDFGFDDDVFEEDAIFDLV